MALNLGRDDQVMKYLEGAGLQFASSAECAQVNVGFLNEATEECKFHSRMCAHTQSTGEYQCFAASVAFPVVVVKT